MKNNYTLIGDVREKLKELPDKSIQMCVTSPPYWALRNYDDQEKQLGLEKTPEEFIKNLVDVFAEVHRVLRDDGTLWLNLGDTYSSQRWAKKGSFTTDAQPINNFKDTHRAIAPEKITDLPPKSLVGIPWKVAIALQEWGWILRQDIIWAKKNCMPESVKDRFTKSHEYIFLLSKQPKYFFNQVLEESVSEIKKRTRKKGEGQDSKIGTKGSAGNSGKRNKRSVWNMRTASYKEAHFAVFPPELAETCIKAGSNENDIVLDCFMGSGTTAMVAQDLFRKWIGVELNPEYEKLIRKRTAQQVLF
jgi:DNA modification methylase